MKLLVLVIGLFLVQSLGCDRTKLKNKSFFCEDQHVELGIRSSVIELGTDSIRIIDFPYSEIGIMKYQIGEWIIDQKKRRIKCIIVKSFQYSTNTGHTLSYRERCNNYFVMRYDDEMNIYRGEDPRKNIKKKYWRNEGHKTSDTMKYIIKEEEEIPVLYQWVKGLDGYKNIDKLINCEN